MEQAIKQCNKFAHFQTIKRPVLLTHKKSLLRNEASFFYAFGNAY
jgi:hypothetical protein